MLGRTRLRPLLFVFLLGCGEEGLDVVPAEELEAPDPSAPEQLDPSEAYGPAEETAGDAVEGESPDAVGRPELRQASFGRRARLDDRTRGRVRSAIRRRIGARPTLVTSLHYPLEDGGTVSIATFTASYVERCVTAGTAREECVFGRGYQSLATDRAPCSFGGIARVDIGPPEGDREGRMDIVAVQTLGDGEICTFEVEGLTTTDEDGDGADEIILSYGWADLRWRRAGLERGREGSRRVTYRADLTPQVTLDVLGHHYPEDDDPDARNVATQLRHVDRDGHPDLALDLIDWRAECPDREPPWGQRECDVQQRTVVHPYDTQRDAWLAPLEPERED